MKQDIDLFIELESKHCLFDAHINDFYFWIYIRDYIYDTIETKKTGRGIASEKNSASIKTILNILQKCILNFSSLRGIYKKEYDIIFMCHPRRTLVNGLFYSIYTDYFANAFQRSFTIESLYEGGHLEPCATDNIFHLDNLYMNRALYMKFKQPQKQYHQYLFDVFAPFCNEVEINYGVSLNVNFVVDRVLLLYKRYVFTKRYFQKIIRLVHPKILVEVVYYSFENLVMNEVCRENNIRIIEMQHGLTGRFHEAYNFPEKIVPKQLPDYIFTFSEFWSNSMRLPDEVKRISTGFYYYEQMKEKYPIQKNRDGLIVLSSGTSGKFLCRFVVELAEKSEIPIIFKLHPSEFSTWKTRYPDLLNSNVKVIDNYDIHLYELFACSIAQLGVYSTAVFEGLGYGLKTFILNTEGVEHVKEIVDSGDAYIVSTPEELMWLYYSIDSSNDSQNEYWKSDSFNNVINSINNILKDVE